MEEKKKKTKNPVLLNQRNQNFKIGSVYSFLNRLLEPCGPQVPDLLNGYEIFAIADLL